MNLDSAALAKELRRVWRGTVADPNEPAEGRDRFGASHTAMRSLHLVGRRMVTHPPRATARQPVTQSCRMADR